MRLTCLDHFQTEEAAGGGFVFRQQAEGEEEHERHHQSGGGEAGADENPSAVGPLIEALVTVHKFKVVGGGGEGVGLAEFQQRPRRAAHGAGLSAGGGPRVRLPDHDQPKRAGRAGCPDGPQLQLRQAGVEVLVQRQEEGPRRDQRAEGTRSSLTVHGPVGGRRHPDCNDVCRGNSEAAFMSVAKSHQERGFPIPLFLDIAVLGQQRFGQTDICRLRAGYRSWTATKS